MLIKNINGFILRVLNVQFSFSILTCIFEYIWIYNLTMKTSLNSYLITIVTVLTLIHSAYSQDIYLPGKGLVLKEFSKQEHLWVKDLTPWLQLHLNYSNAIALIPMHKDNSLSESQVIQYQILQEDNQVKSNSLMDRIY